MVGPAAESGSRVPEEPAPAADLRSGAPEERAPAAEPGSRVPEERAPASVSKDPDDWQTRLRSQGYRLTPQRELVLAAVEELGHATPDEVYAEVRTHSDSINLSTVYRTLELLNELGLIRHAHLTDRAPTYHSARGHEHAHLVCRECRRTFSIGAEEVHSALGALIADRGFTPDYGHLTVFGTCAQCGASG